MIKSRIIKTKKRKQKSSCLHKTKKSTIRGGFWEKLRFWRKKSKDITPSITSMKPATPPRILTLRPVTTAIAPVRSQPQLASITAQAIRRREEQIASIAASRAKTRAAKELVEREKKLASIALAREEQRMTSAAPSIQSTPVAAPSLKIQTTSAVAPTQTFGISPISIMAKKAEKTKLAKEAQQAAQRARKLSFNKAQRNAVLKSPDGRNNLLRKSFSGITPTEIEKLSKKQKMKLSKYARGVTALNHRYLSREQLKQIRIQQQLRIQQPKSVNNQLISLGQKYNPQSLKTNAEKEAEKAAHWAFLMGPKKGHEIEARKLAMYGTR
jgi:hypothetical protein